jgi:hypothetical protein
MILAEARCVDMQRTVAALHASPPRARPAQVATPPQQDPRATALLYLEDALQKARSALDDAAKLADELRAPTTLAEVRRHITLTVLTFIECALGVEAPAVDERKRQAWLALVEEEANSEAAAKDPALGARCVELGKRVASNQPIRGQSPALPSAFFCGRA